MYLYMCESEITHSTGSVHASWTVLRRDWHRCGRTPAWPDTRIHLPYCSDRHQTRTRTQTQPHPRGEHSAGRVLSCSWPHIVTSDPETHAYTLLKTAKKCNLYHKADRMNCNKVVVFVVQASVWLSLILRCCCSSVMGARRVYRVHLLLSWPRNLQSHMDHLSENLNIHIYKSTNFRKPVKNMFWSYFISKCTLKKLFKVWSL